MGRREEERGLPRGMTLADAYGLIHREPATPSRSSSDDSSDLRGESTAFPSGTVAEVTIHAPATVSAGAVVAEAARIAEEEGSHHLLVVVTRKELSQRVRASPMNGGAS